MQKITPSLISDWKWYLHDESEGARNKFISRLRKDKTEISEAAQFGIDFENDINKAINNNINYHSAMSDREFTLCEIAKQLKGAYYQVWVEKPYKDILLCGYTDFILPAEIIDIKTTQNYQKEHKFKNSFQHHIYMYCTDINYFRYIVLEYYKYAKYGYNYKGLYYEDYIYEPGSIESICDEFLSWLEFDKELKELYYDNWRV